MTRRPPFGQRAQPPCGTSPHPSGEAAAGVSYRLCK